MHSAFIEHQRVSKSFNGLSRTQQSFKDETDINNIMAKYQKTGLIDHINEHGAHYGDQPNAEDYHAALSLVASTSSIFEELPSSTREEFDNDPAKFLEYVSDEDRREDMIKTGKINQDDTEPKEPETSETPEKPGDTE